MTTTPMLNESSLENVTDLAVDLLDEIQDLIGSSWNIDFQVPDDMGTITGTTDDITYKLSYSFCLLYTSDAADE